MFQLIVAVISIALVAALAIASIYYGGQAFQKSAVKAAADTLVNGGQQISGAEALYRTDFGGSTSTDAGFADLLSTTGPSGSYLSALPTLPSGLTGSWTLGVSGTAPAATVPASADICAVMPASNGQYGCNGSTFFFVL